MSSTVAFDEILEQAKIPSLEIDFSAERNKDYCGLVNEINPLHFDLEYARALGYKDIVVAGIFTASLFPKLITDWLGGQAVIERMGVKFGSPAYLNDTVTYRGRVEKKLIEAGVKRLECDVWSENAVSERLASATILLRFREE
jgi:3-hydroxybutyryl-CoA dehydratase